MHYEDYLEKMVFEKFNEKERACFLNSFSRDMKKELINKGFDKEFVECALIYVNMKLSLHRRSGDVKQILSCLRGYFPVEFRKDFL